MPLIEVNPQLAYTAINVAICIQKKESSMVLAPVTEFYQVVHSKRVESIPAVQPRKQTLTESPGAQQMTSCETL